MSIDATAAAIFLPFAVAIGIWVAWSDMKFMKIPNKAVYAMFGVFVVVGIFVFPFTEYLWRYLHMVLVLAIGFVLNIARAMGAGDAKFLAAAAPLLHANDLLIIVQVFAAVLLAAFFTHRLFRAIPAVRRGFPDWKSWDHQKFPMGLALSGAVVLYLALGVLLGR